MPRLNAGQPIVDDDGTMAPHFRDQMTRLDNNLPIVGSGTPEGEVEARQFSLYIDQDGTTGSIEYRKMQTDIAGDTSMGWVLV